MLDHLGYRTGAQRHHRRTAGHGLDHHHAERLLPLDREDQAARAGQQVPLGGRVGDAEHLVGVGQPGPDLPIEVPRLDRLGALAGQHHRQPGGVRGVQRQMRRLVRVVAAEEEGEVLLVFPVRPGVQAQRVVHGAHPVQVGGERQTVSQSPRPNLRRKSDSQFVAPR